MRISIFMFYAILLAAVFGIQYYLYRRVTKYVSTKKNPSFFLWLVRAVFSAFIVPVVALAIWQPKLAAAPGWAILFFFFPLYLWHFSCLLLFLFLMVGKLLQLPFHVSTRLLARFEGPRRWLMGSNVQRFDARRRVFLRQGVTLLAGASFAGSAVGAIRRNEYETNQIAIPVPHLPEEFEGFSIALLSDIHSSVFMTKETMQRYVRAANGLGTDMIAVVGDFVNSQVDEVYPFAEAFADLAAPYGVFGVLGNHDYYSRDVDTVARLVNDCGIRLLVNSRTAIRKNNSVLNLLGADDTGNAPKAAASFDRMLTGIDGQQPTVLLCHRPYFFQQAADRNIGLTLSGHTHGGQIVFAKVGDEIVSLARVASPYVAGLYSIGSSRMYVSRGIGTVGVPVRINCPPEITKIVLTRS
jgi:predicted MPP superfamily phosphohydrolase